MAATYTKLKSGAWGVRVEGGSAPKKGATVTVTKKNGGTKTETITQVVWSGNGIHLCAIAPTMTATSGGSRGRSFPRGRRTGCACGSIEGEYHDWYCSSCRFDELDN